MSGQLLLTKGCPGPLLARLLPPVSCPMGQRWLGEQQHPASKHAGICSAHRTFSPSQGEAAGSECFSSTVKAVWERRRDYTCDLNISHLRSNTVCCSPSLRRHHDGNERCQFAGEHQHLSSESRERQGEKSGLRSQRPQRWSAQGRGGWPQKPLLLPKLKKAEFTRLGVLHPQNLT